MIVPDKVLGHVKRWLIPTWERVHSCLRNLPSISNIILGIFLLVLHDLLDILQWAQGTRHYPIIHTHQIQLCTKIDVQVG